MTRRALWAAFLLANIPAHLALLALLRIEHSIDGAFVAAIGVKLVYFALVTSAVIFVQRHWHAGASSAPSRETWAYRATGLAAIALLLVLHAEHVYRFGNDAVSLKHHLAETNASLPKTIETGVTLQAVDSTARTIIYRHSLDAVKADAIDRAQFQTRMRAALTASICNNEELRGLINKGFSLQYDYRGSAGGLLFDDIFTAQSCADPGRG